MSDNMILDWNDTIENDGSEFVLLESGDYNFKVTNFERGRFPGSEKIPACNKAVITVSVETDNGTAVVKFDLILYQTLEWKLSSFFRCIGQKKHGEKLKMNWGKVVGSQGRAHFIQKTYTKNGEERVINDISTFYDYDSTNFSEGDFKEIPDEDDLPWD